jgi:hypothetical protein
MKLTEIKTIMKNNKIRGFSQMNKAEIITILLDKGLITPEAIQKPKSFKPEPIKRHIEPKYAFTRMIRNNPKQVEIKNPETGEVTIHSSIYKASRWFGNSTSVITQNNGKRWGGYDIKILS